jgi:CubicO group peptidase (beta-lactamase class C family)
MDMKKLEVFLNDLFEEYRGSIPGASVSVIFDNKLNVVKNYGLANLKTNTKISAKTNFRLASVTKQFTATCILQLVDKGLIKLDDKLIKYFPQFKYAKQITIYQLLTHTSGFLDYEDLIRKNRKNPISDKEVLNLLSRQKKFKFKSGKSWSYNNGTYCILKELLEKISGLNYTDYLQKYVFTPLEMNTTVLSERNKTQIKNRAFGYSKTKNNFIKTDNNITSFTMGDGSIYSNVEDLSKWTFGRKRILSKKSYELSKSPLAPTDEKNEFYGFGLNVTKYLDNKVIYHGGFSIGFRSSIYLIPNKQIGIIFLSNLHKNEGSDFTKKIAKFIIENNINF